MLHVIKKKREYFCLFFFPQKRKLTQCPPRVRSSPSGRPLLSMMCFLFPLCCRTFQQSWLNTARLVFVQAPGRDHSPPETAASHICAAPNQLDGSFLTKKKKITSSASSRKAWCVRHLHDSSLNPPKSTFYSRSSPDRVVSSSSRGHVIQGGSQKEDRKRTSCLMQVDVMDGDGRLLGWNIRSASRINRGRVLCKQTAKPFLKKKK